MQDLKSEPEPTPSGFQQSPIDIISKDCFSVREELKAFHYVQESYPGSIMEDYGHFRYELDASKFDNLPALIFRSTDAVLASVHFHARSEHVINGGDFAAEFHLVHKVVPKENPGADHIDEPSSLLVVGVLVNVETDDKESIDKFPNLQQLLLNLRKGIDKTTTDKVDLDPEIFRRAEQQLHSFYHYRGSLTTGPDESKPFLETVSWFVIQNPIKLPKSIMDRVGEVEQRTRGLQPLERRIVLSCNSK